MLGEVLYCSKTTHAGRGLIEAARSPLREGIRFSDAIEADDYDGDVVCARLILQQADLRSLRAWLLTLLQMGVMHGLTGMQKACRRGLAPSSCQSQ